MQPRHKIFLVFLAVLAGMVLIACSCTDLSSLVGTNDDVSEPDLAGTWQDPETADLIVISRKGSGYEVISVTWESIMYEITEQSWDGSSLTWTYYVPENDIYLTYETTSLSGDSLYTNWWNSGGDSGTEILERVR